MHKYRKFREHLHVASAQVKKAHFEQRGFLWHPKLSSASEALAKDAAKSAAKDAAKSVAKDAAKSVAKAQSPGLAFPAPFSLVHFFWTNKRNEHSPFGATPHNLCKQKNRAKLQIKSASAEQ